MLGKKDEEKNDLKYFNWFLLAIDPKGAWHLQHSRRIETREGCWRSIMYATVYVFLYQLLF